MDDPKSSGDLLSETDTESRLAEIWSELLGQDDISGNSRFTALGGHSLAHVRLIARVYEVFSVALTMAEVRENDSLQGLAKCIDNQVREDPSGECRRIPVADRKPPVPLSHTQEHLLVESLKAPDEPVYNEVATIRFHGPIDEGRLVRAFSQLVERHDSFRTSFEWESGDLLQVVHPEAHVDLSRVDFSEYDPSQREEKAEAHANEWAAQPFNLKKPPLMRAMLGWISPNDARLYIVAHHLVIDAQTLFEIVVHDLWSMYSALEKDAPAQLPELPIQYPDYAVWKKKINGARPSDLVDYWKEKLKGFQPTCLQREARHPDTGSRQGRRKVFYLTPELSRKIKLTALDTETTPFVVLLSAFKSLLQHRTGVDDITLGTVTSARDHPDTQHVAGCFLNFLPLRTKCPSENSFQNVVASVKETLNEAIAHQDVPLSAISDALRSSGDLGRSPIYRIMFLLEPPREKHSFGWSVDRLSFHPGASKLDLTVEMDEAGGRFFGRVEYRTELFAAEFIDHLIRQYSQILEQAVESPEAQISSLNLVAVEESEQVLRTFNRSDHAVKSHYRLHDFMEQRAIDNPDAIAVEYLDQSLSYGALKRYSDNIASMLSSEGVLRNDVIAVVARRSIWLPVALFGVLKSGAAYLPIDPDQPEERVQSLLKDSQVKIALVGKDVDLENKGPLDIKVFNTTQAAEVPAENAPPDTALPNDLAYVLYTSGSTGKPKAAMIEHRSIVNRLLWMAHEYGFDETDVQLQKTPITFDVSLHELFLWSLVGARLAIPPPGVERDPAELIRSIQAHRVTQVHFVPSMLDVFLTYLKAFGNGRSLFTLKHVHCSGEALPPASVDAFQRLIGRPLGIGLHNLYGPTEAAVDVSFYDCSHFEGGSSVPIGKPVWNTRLYVLDANLRPVPVGSPGELYIGGIQVGRGYLNRPDLTREAFVPDPFSKEPGARLYRTGDQARWMPDGNLEYLGRNDFQIKIRGVRIEPAEIEAVMRDYPSITAAACVARKRSDGEVILHGYYTTSESVQTDSQKGLLEHLKARLPSQMIPASLTQLESFPLNSSGKLDRKLLPDPSFTENTTSSPRTAEERILAGIWEAVLKVGGIGPEADFFQNGGDSIQAIQVISKVRQHGYLLNLRHMFDCASLAEVAAEMKHIESVNAPTPDRPSQSSLVPIQNWFFALGLRSPSHWNQSRLIEFSKPVKAPTLEAALQAVVANHDSLRLRFRQTDDGWIQELNPVEKPLSLDVITASDAQGPADQNVEELCQHLQASLDIRTGSVMKAALFPAQGKQGENLFICIHHLVTDGVSWQVILEDLESAYNQLETSGQVDLPKETTSFLSWPSILTGYSGQLKEKPPEEANQSNPSRVAEFIPTLASNRDNPFSTVSESRRSLSTKETDQLLKEVPSRYKTEINDILLTALALLFKSIGARDTITLFLEGHGREPISDFADPGRTTGWFTSLFPVTLRTDFVDTDAAIKSTKEHLRSIPGKGLDFGIHHYLGKRVSQSDSVRPELLFNYLGNMDRHLAELSLISRATPLWQSECAPDDERPWTHEMLAWIEHGQLTVGWYFSTNLHAEETISQLLESYMEFIQDVIRHCLSSPSGGYTPSDFNSSGLSQDELDELYSDFESMNE